MPRNNASCLAYAIIYQSLSPPRLEKKYFLCTVIFPLSGRNWNSKKLLAAEGCIYSIYTFLSRHASPNSFPTSQTADVVPPVAKTPASVHSSMEEWLLPAEAQRNRARLQYCSSEILPPQAYPHMAIDTHYPGPAILGTGRWKLS